MQRLKGFSFTIMDTVFQSQLLVVKFGFSTRSIYSYSIVFMLIPVILLFSQFFMVQSYTQYIPLPISDLDSWLKTPSIYVFDCSAAGMIINAFTEVLTVNYAFRITYLSVVIYHHQEHYFLSFFVFFG